MNARVDASRLDAVGYGQQQPIDTNNTAAGRDKNRRVEFTILDPTAETPTADVKTP